MNAHGRDASSEEPDELRLSPSETMAVGGAMRVSGAARPGADPAGAKTQRALASITLGFELFVVVLMGLTLFGLSVLEPRALGLWIGGGLAVVILAALGLMRVGRVGIVLGWVTHALMIAVAILIPMSLIISLLFTALWVFCMVKGAQIDRQRRAWLAAQE